MSKRIRARVVAHWRVAYRHAQGQGEGLLLDLSLQGCHITGVPPCACGSRLRLQLWLPDQAQPMAVEQAVVRWIKTDQFGVSFLDVPPDTRARLAQVFRLLDEAQQPEVHLISVPAFLGCGRGQKAVVPA
jgi:hypothetical protein